MELGKLPPQAIDLEEAVLGACMLESIAIETTEFLKPEMFYKGANEIIYGAIQELRLSKEPIDILTVSQKLRSKKQLEAVGGPLYISQLTNRVASTANIESHARIIYQKWISRELISISGELIKSCYEDEDDVFALIDMADNRLKSLHRDSTAGLRHISEIIQETTKHITERKEKNGLSGISTGLNSLDRAMGGWTPTNFVVVGARPGMGKSAFVVTAANAASQSGYPVAIFSLEMSDIQVTYRLLSQISQVDGNELAKNILDIDRLRAYYAATDEANKLPVFIDHTGGLTIQEFSIRARTAVKKLGVKLIMIDYIQLMTDKNFAKSSSREGEVSSISRQIKSLAKELDVPIIGLSQLSRQVESRSDKRPMLSDLRESGAIEQDADDVIFIYRDEYYGITVDTNGHSTSGKAEIIIAKQRNGTMCICDARYVPHLTKFEDYNTYQSDRF